MTGIIIENFYPQKKPSQNNIIHSFRSIISINNNADIRKWHHLGIIVDADANIIRVYINGSLYAKETLTIRIIDNLINANVTVNAFLSEDSKAGLFNFQCKEMLKYSLSYLK